MNKSPSATAPHRYLAFLLPPATAHLCSSAKSRSSSRRGVERGGALGCAPQRPAARRGRPAQAGVRPPCQCQCPAGNSRFVPRMAGRLRHAGLFPRCLYPSSSAPPRPVRTLAATGPLSAVHCPPGPPGPDWPDCAGLWCGRDPAGPEASTFAAATAPHPYRRPRPQQQPQQPQQQPPPCSTQSHLKWGLPLTCPCIATGLGPEASLGRAVRTARTAGTALALHRHGPAPSRPQCHPGGNKGLSSSSSPLRV